MTDPLRELTKILVRAAIRRGLILPGGPAKPALDAPATRPSAQVIRLADRRRRV